MDVETAAMTFEKLGHPVRLQIVQLLVRAGPGGLPVGALRRVLDIPPSTLSHHVSHLVSGEVITQTRDSRRLICRTNFTRIDQLVELLTESCCAGVEIGEDEDDKAVADATAA